MYNQSIYVFTRDLRLDDNLGLIEACEKSKKVLPVFIFTGDQASTTRNKHFSSNAFQFMLESLHEMSKTITFMEAETMISGLKKLKFDAIFISHDITPYAKKRENALKKAFPGIVHVNDGNHFLIPDEEIFNKIIADSSGKPYFQFTMFKNKFNSLVKVDKPKKFRHGSKLLPPMKGSSSVLEKQFKKIIMNKNLEIHGGRKEALKLFKTQSLKEYSKASKKNIEPNSRSNLSPYHKFGCISIRESWHRYGIMIFREQLLWREFYYYILVHRPKNLHSNHNEKWNKYPWSRNTRLLNAWKRGDTGYPIIDAGMRQLVETGYMHNRVRLLVANFLTKNLGVHWKYGEKFFNEHLLDYDPAVNNGNWQWCAGSGVDPLRYGKPRVMNIFHQQKKYDKDCKYIKRWLPEFKDMKPSEIHNEKNHDLIVDYKETIDLFFKNYYKYVK